MDVADLVPLSGGWSGQTFLAETGGQRSVVRIYPPGLRDERAPEVDAAVLRLVRGLVPVPEVLEVRRAQAAADRPGLLVTSWMPGERGDLLLPTVDDDGLRTVATHVGGMLADLAGMPTLRPGAFVDADLSIGPFGVAATLPEYVADHARDLVAEGWSATEVDALTALADDAQARLDEVDRTCLVHSDVNPKNLLVDPRTLELTALLDWEFAHSGHPFTDLGNVLRFEREPAYADTVLATWCDRRGGTPDAALETARAADLWALVDLAARAGANPVATRAGALLRAIVAEGDLHASP